MASTDNVEENTKFAKATSVTLQGRGGGAGDGRREEGSRLPAAQRPDQGSGDEVRRADGERPDGANRWTFYIDKNGKVVAIDTVVRPATSAEDMITKLGELKVAKKGYQE